MDVVLLIIAWAVMNVLILVFFAGATEKEEDE